MFFSRKSRRRSNRSQPTPKLQTEALESRQMMFTWSMSGGVLVGDGDATAEHADLSVIAGTVYDGTVNLGVTASAVTKIEITGKGNNDIIDLRKLTAADMPNLTSTELHGDGSFTLNTGADIIYGSFANDKIWGDAQADKLYGMGGNDFIDGNLGDDVICGGTGHDVLEGGWGDDRICGGEGNDRIKGGPGGDVLLGNAGNDTIQGGTGRDIIDGGAGSDSIDAKELIANKDVVYYDSGDSVQYNTGTLFGIGKDVLIFGASSIECPCDVDVGGDDCKETDFGDAPASYGTVTTGSTVGASHHIRATGPRLGDYVDPEPNGQPSGGANGDDNAIWDDEDGITFAGGPTIYAGHTHEVDVKVTNVLPGGQARLDAWIDFNGDGDFLDANEKIFHSQPVGLGTNTLSYSVPYFGSLLGPTYARFRISSAGGLGPTGLASDGEVEDYAVVIHCEGHGGLEPGEWPSDLVFATTSPDPNVAFGEQIDHLKSTSRGDDDNWIFLESFSVPGVMDGSEYTESHGITFENLRGEIGVQYEEGRYVEKLDAYDGRRDGQLVLTSHPNTDAADPFTIHFESPVATFGAFVATGSEGDNHRLTVEARNVDGEVLRRFEIDVFENADADNYENYLVMGSSQNEIASLIILNNNDTDYGNALVIGDLRWAMNEPGTIEPAADVDDHNADGIVDLADLDLVTAGVHDGQFEQNRLDGFLRRQHTGVGDANFDHEFGTTDLVLAFQAGKYETGQRASWSEGDWNADGVFDTSDLVRAFQEGWFETGPRQPSSGTGPIADAAINAEIVFADLSAAVEHTDDWKSNIG